MLDTALALLRKDRLLKYVIGGGTWILLIGLLGSVAYNGLWDDDNKWTNLEFGRPRQTHAYAVATIVMGLFAFIAILAALLLSIFKPELQLVQIILWGSGYLLTLITISVQGAGLDYTTYAIGRVQDEYNYLEQHDDFKKYVADYAGPNYSVDTFTLSVIPNARAAAGLAPLNPNFFTVDLEAFYVHYREKVEGQPQYARKSVASCAFDWSQLALDDTVFSGDPCSFKIDDGDVKECIGGWSGADFIDYWCHQWTIAEDDRKFAEEGATLPDIQKRQQIRYRDAQVIDSVAAYYRHNTYLIGINVASMLVSAIAVGLDFWLSKKDGGAEKGADLEELEDDEKPAKRAKAAKPAKAAPAKSEPAQSEPAAEPAKPPEGSD